MFVNVDDVSWTVSEVVKMSREQFVATFMADEHMYSKHGEERKKVALNAVYDQCVPTEPEEVKPKGKKPKGELELDAE